VCDVHGDSHVGEVKPIAQPNQADRNEVMRNKLAKVLARLLQHQQQDDELLRPVASLEQVVRLDDALIGAVREALVHADGVEVPHGCARHDPQPKGPVETKVQRGIRLLHETRLLRAALDAVVYRNRPDESLHAVLAREAQDDDVKPDKRKVACSLAIMDWPIRVGADVCWDKRVLAIERV
jgi:hypothetical protein